MISLADFAERLAAERDLEGQRRAAVLAFASRLSREDALEIRRLSRVMMDDAAMADMGFDDPNAAIAARQIITARQMQLDGEPIDTEVTDPYASTRAMIAAFREAGNVEQANRLQAGIEAAIAEDAAKAKAEARAAAAAQAKAEADAAAEAWAKARIEARAKAEADARAALEALEAAEAAGNSQEE